MTVELLPYSNNWGKLVLVLGVITMALGGIRGVMSNNFKTTIAYSSMSQIGFILVGVGMQALAAETMACKTGVVYDCRYCLSECGKL